MAACSTSSVFEVTDGLQRLKIVPWYFCAYSYGGAEKVAAHMDPLTFTLILNRQGPPSSPPTTLGVHSIAISSVSPR